MPTLIRAYRFELRPTKEQIQRLDQMANARRFAYNWGLARWREHHAKTGKSIPLSQLMTELTALKGARGFTWLREVDSQALQQALFDLRAAYRNFFEKRSRYPRFKSRKHDCQRFRIPQRVRVAGSEVYVPKIGFIRLRLTRQLPGRTRSAAFRRDATGKWFVTFVVEREVPERPCAPASPKAVGVDLGLHDFVVLSDGTRIPRPRFAASARRRLKRAHRELSRTSPKSRNRIRARRRLAREYRRVANRRRDFLHKLSTKLVQEWDVIAVEDLGVAGLARTKLAGALADSSFRQFRTQLEYKAETGSAEVVVVDRFFPSSRTCAECGTVNRKLKPRQRVWRCSCGADLDRDLNAARNLRAFALEKLVAVGPTDTANAYGVRVSPPTEAANVEVGIPA